MKATLAALDFENLAAAVLHSCDHHSDRTAQIYCSTFNDYSEKRSYSKLSSAILSVASGLLTHGFEPGMIAAIYASTSPEWNIADYAIMACGGATAGIYTNDSLDEVKNKLVDSRANTLFVDTEKKLMAALSIPREELPDLTTIVPFYAPALSIDDDRIRAFGNYLAAKHNTATLNKIILSQKSSSLARIVYTIGLDGISRGAMLTHKNLLANLRDCAGLLHFSQEDVCLSHMPSAHALQSMIANLMMLSGGALAFVRKNGFPDDLAKIRPTILPGVPGIFHRLLEAARDKLSEAVGKPFDIGNEKIEPALLKIIRETMGLDNIRMCISGGAKLDPEAAAILEYDLDIPVLEGYGMSETSPVISVNTFSAKKPRTVGKPVPSAQVKIVDEEGIPVRPGKLGEITVKGDSVFSGYLNHKECNARIFSPDGYFHTGDHGFMDHDGFLVIQGRKGSKVKFANGEYYDLEETGRKFLKRCRLIGQAAIAGEQREYPVCLVTLSEDLRAAVKFAESNGITYSDPRELIHHERIIEAVRNEFFEIKNNPAGENKMERPVKAIYLRPFSTRNKEATATGKVRLKKVLSKYAREIADLYASNEEFVALMAGDTDE